MKYDSVHGKIHAEVSHTADSIVVNGKSIRIYAEKDPEKLPWKDLGVDVVIESLINRIEVCTTREQVVPLGQSLARASCFVGSWFFKAKR